MHWTKDLPTQEGFWFCRYGETLWIYCLIWENGRLRITSSLFPSNNNRTYVDEAKDQGFEWAGPIPMPEEGD